jgi:hypothetical protein
MVKFLKSINNQKSAAMVAGISLLVMTLAAFFSYGYVHSSLITESSPIMTIENIKESSLLFNLEIVGWVVIIITDLLVSWALYAFLKPTHKKLAQIAGLARIIYTGVLALAVSNLINASLMAKSTVSPQSASQTMSSIASFEATWSFGLIIFGLHLLLVGIVALKATHIPRLFSYLLMAAGISYSVVHLMNGFFPELESIKSMLEMVLSVPMFVGEIGFGIWLLLKGRKYHNINRQPLTS